MFVGARYQTRKYANYWIETLYTKRLDRQPTDHMITNSLTRGNGHCDEQRLRGAAVPSPDLRSDKMGYRLGFSTGGLSYVLDGFSAYSTIRK